MPETLTKAAKSQDAERAQEKKRQLEPASLPMKALADESIPFAGLLGVSAMELPIERHAAFLDDPRFSHPANNAQKARIVTELQGAYGNQYVQRLIQSMKVQAKLAVSSPDDQYEWEADRVADAVTRTSAPSTQRQAEEEEEEEIQAKPIADQITPLVQKQEEEPEEEEEPIQAKRAGGQTPLISSSLQSQINSLKGGGQPLPESTRKYFESRFGSSFNNVRIHNNSQAADIAKSINAKAFTKGQDIAFGAGQYSPETSGGKRLLAHELTHVVQQDLSTVRGGEISKLNEPAEAEAQRVGETISCDRQLLPIKASAAQVSRQGLGPMGPAPLFVGAIGERVRSRPLPDEVLVTKLKKQVADGGITVALYAAPRVSQRAVFEKEAMNFAKDYSAVGMTDGQVKIPQAMTLSKRACELMKDTTDGVGKLLQKDSRAAKPPVVRVKTLAIFTHGWKTNVQAGKGGTRVNIYDVADWAKSLVPYLAPDVKVILYACMVAKGNMSFAERLYKSLTDAMASLFRPGKIAPEVWGHTTTAHTTANPQLRAFYKGGSKALPETCAEEMLKGALDDMKPQLPLTTWKRNWLLNELKMFWGEIIPLGSWRKWENLPPDLSNFVRDIPFRADLKSVYVDIKAGKAPVRVIATFKKVNDWLKHWVSPSNIRKAPKALPMPAVYKGIAAPKPEPKRRRRKAR